GGGGREMRLGQGQGRRSVRGFGWGFDGRHRPPATGALRVTRRMTDSGGGTFLPTAGTASQPAQSPNRADLSRESRWVRNEKGKRKKRKKKALRRFPFAFPLSHLASCRSAPQRTRTCAPCPSC